LLEYDAIMHSICAKDDGGDDDDDYYYYESEKSEKATRVCPCFRIKTENYGKLGELEEIHWTVYFRN